MSATRAEQGRQMFERVYGSRMSANLERIERLDPGLVEFADEFVFGRVWARDGLELEQRFLIALTSLASLARYTQLPNYINGAIEAGIDPEVIREAFLMLTVYGGFPVATNALEILNDVLAQRETS
jgi:4-carboxymuconolactone decarboxylase